MKQMDFELFAVFALGPKFTAVSFKALLSPLKALKKSREEKKKNRLADWQNGQKWV